jgi:hypothetical protein
MKNNKNNDRWYMSSTFFESNPNRVDLAKGIIYGVSITTMGEAKGHNVNLDSEFIDETIKQGNLLKQGLKIRFGHPNMSSTALGTFLGRAKNFSRSGDIAKADIFLSNSAKEAPGGDLYNYVLNLANDDPEAFGMSIVFERGDLYQLNDKQEKVYENLDAEEITYVELKKLIASDFVDSPAANPQGVFSEFNNMTMAAQVTEFLDTHPEVLEHISKNPEIIEKFTQRYNEYLKLKQGVVMKEEIPNNETLEIEESADALDNNPAVEEETESVEAVVELTETELSEELKEVVEEELKLEIEVVEEELEVEELVSSLEAVVEKTEKEKFIEFAELEGYEFAKEHYGKSDAELLAVKNAALELSNASLKEENEALKKAISDADAISFSEEQPAVSFQSVIEAHKAAGLSTSRAYSKAIKDNPELYNSYMNKGAK